MPLIAIAFRDLRRQMVAFIVLGMIVLAAGVEAGEVRQIGKIRSDDLTESSGIVASARYDDVYWTHNDSKNAPFLFAIKTDGTIVRQVRVAANHVDWEDIAADAGGNLYVANIGNNDANRDFAEVHRLDEPDFAPQTKGKKKNAVKRPAKTNADVTWRLRYPDRPFNAESLFIHDGHGYVISKMPIGQKAAIYRFALDEAKRDVTLEKVAELDIDRPVTGAAISPDGKQMAVLSMTALHLYEINGEVASAGKSKAREIAIPAKKLEAVTYVEGGLLMTAESGEIYQLDLPAVD